MLITFVIALIVSGVRARPATSSSTCGGVAGLNPCGGSYPSDFCCPSSAQCLPVNASALAVICCPLGVDCRTLQPTTCDLSAYDASKLPQNQIHIQNAQNLTTCGNACCPPGFDCRNGNCFAVTTSSSTTTSTQASSTSATVAATSAAIASAVADVQATSQGFSGSSFAAGFVPGILLGVLLVVLLLWLRRRRKTTTHDEKLQSPPPLPPMIAISQPFETEHHRTDFLRSTSHEAAPYERPSTSSDSQQDQSSAASTDLRPMLDFDSAHPRSPSPAFLHRALSFRFSPQGKLRNKQSMHSLKRHMNAQADTLSIDRSDSSKSTGTIKVALPPEESPWYGQPAPRRPDTPTRSPRFLHPQALGSPYTPSRYNDSYVEPQRSARRVTTFSSLMEKAGFRRREFEDL